MPFSAASRLPLVEALLPVAIAAGDAILAVRRSGHGVEWKADHSPVTEADRAAEKVITEELARLVPEIPVIAEEAAYEGRLPDADADFFLVDPLDGTREFVKGGNDFTVNIGLICAGEPVVGVILLPETGKLFWGAVGAGAWRGRAVGGSVAERGPIRVRPVPDGPIAVVASRSHRTPETDAYIRQYDVGDLVSAGSSMKFCVLASGKADLYPRMGTTMQWDTAAGDAILRAAGGKVVTLDGRPLGYGPNGSAGPEAYRNPWFIAASAFEPLPYVPPGGQSRSTET
jgi:3'(2'),5'-bisphosphate nucleotidase